MSKQQKILNLVLDLYRELEPIQSEINKLAIEDLELRNMEDWDKDCSEAIQSYRTYD